ncbi:acylphosphatase [Halomonas sp. HP20-15]|uniref:acylphosphatase n=1 Tax=Halomonas sp. HP20-15 TaxID=3085901 RepID=UPI0029821B9F|nr:acylphosphatase [Halomonas sp. HP20-15]MDW5375559.1 acylphosphatase [Halomonas sp. HP20-15]
MESSCCVKAYVSGQVQGVSYRAAVQERALTTKVTGYARNLPDGRVEVLLCGDRDAVNALTQWLWQGPPAARVAHVELQRVEWRDRTGFVTR